MNPADFRCVSNSACLRENPLVVARYGSGILSVRPDPAPARIWCVAVGLL
jgi:hypothetical protein